MAMSPPLGLTDNRYVASHALPTIRVGYFIWSGRNRLRYQQQAPQVVLPPSATSSSSLSKRTGRRVTGGLVTPSRRLSSLKTDYHVGKVGTIGCRGVNQVGIKLSTRLLERIQARRMLTALEQVPEELRYSVDRAFGSARVTFKPSRQTWVFATLWIEAPEELKTLLQYRAAVLCCQIYDETRAVIVPIVLTPEEAAKPA